MTWQIKLWMYKGCPINFDDGTSIRLTYGDDETVHLKEKSQAPKEELETQSTGSNDQT